MQFLGPGVCGTIRFRKRSTWRLVRRHPKTDPSVPGSLPAGDGSWFRGHTRTFLCLAVFLHGTGGAGAGTLDDLVRELLQRSPAIHAARRSVDAKRALVTAARTLPDPTVSFETMGNLIPPTLQAGDPSSARVLSVVQEIPFPGKLDLAGQISSVMADAEWWRYEEIRRRLVAELKGAYFDLVLAKKNREVVEKNKSLLEQFAEISGARYRVGQAAQQDVLKAQVEVTRMLDRLAVLEREEETARSRINTLLYRSADTPVQPDADWMEPSFRLTMDQVYERARAGNPEVRKGQKDVDRGELALALARKSHYPDFEVGFSYYNRRDVPEMYGLMFKAKVPLYFWRKQRPELESAASDLVAQRHQYDDSLSTLYFRLKDPYLRIQTDRNLMELYRAAVIPQATLALESSISSYRVGGVDFLSLLSNLSTVLEYEIKYNEVLADCYKALVVLESLTGEVLIP